MASLLVCILKGKDGCDGIRLAVDYRYMNKFTILMTRILTRYPKHLPECV